MRALPILLLLASCGGAVQQPPATQRPRAQANQAATKPVHQSPKAHYEGDQANYALATLDNKDAKLAQVRAPVTFVAVWASFCEPCQGSLRFVQALHDKYKRNPKVRVVLVSIDDNDAATRAKIKKVAAALSLSMPMFIDAKHELMERIAPRDAENKPRYAVPLMVVIDNKFRLRRTWAVSHELGKDGFVGLLSKMVDGALRGEAPPPEKAYKTPLGGSYSKRTVKLTVSNLSEHEIDHYREELQHRFRKMVPGLSPAQLASLMVEVEDKLRKGGTFVIKLPSP